MVGHGRIHFSLHTMNKTSLLSNIQNGEPTPFIGIYDTFSASLAAEKYSCMFVSGYGFAASYYGMPDIGFIAWTDLLNFVQRLRFAVPHTHLLVDIDDGYCDTEVARHVALQMEQMGVFGVVLEDQKRPRRCGHVGGKQILPLPEYLDKLKAVLATTKDLFVVARTDTCDPEDVLERVAAFSEAGAHAVLADGLKDLNMITKIKEVANCPVAFNQMSGGKSPNCNWTELKQHGASIIIYSTPCLFSAQGAIRKSLQTLMDSNGSLEQLGEDDPVLTDCNSILDNNLREKD